MDPVTALGVAASTFQLLHVLHNIYRYGNAAYNSKSEQRKLKGAFENLEVKLNRLEVQERKTLDHPDDPMYQGFLAVLRSSTPMTDNERVSPDPTGKNPGALQQLKTDMENMEAKLISRSGCKAQSRRLFWYQERKKFQEMIDDINKWTAAVDSILIPDVIMDTNERVRIIDDKVDDAARDRARKAVEKRRKEIVTWLSPLKFRERQFALLNGVQATIIEPDLLVSEEFKLWKDNHPWILYCQGKPGAGKTLLCAIVIKHLTVAFENRDIPILCMYLNYKEQGRQSLDNLVASLLKQLIQREGAEFRSQEATRLYQGAENEGRPDDNTFFNALCAEIKCHERVVVVIDALDEASSNVAPRLLDMLYRLPKDRSSVMITSQRPEDGLPTSIQIQCDICQKHPIEVYYQCLTCNGGDFYICQSCRIEGAHCENVNHHLTEPPEILKDVEPSEDAIRLYVQAALDFEWKLGVSAAGNNHVSTFGTTPLGRLMRSQKSLKDEIVTSVVANADNTYVLAGLYLSSLTSLGLSEAEILDLLRNPPEGYSELYEKHMERIQASGIGNSLGHASSLGTRVLLWVVCTKRPLSLAELQDALAVDLKKHELDPAARHDKATIIAVTAGLITIDNNGNNGNEAVRLNHQTAQQYFDENRERYFPNASAEITKVALHYLSINELSEPCENEWEDKYFQMRKVDYPFLEYAYEYWGSHAAEADSDPGVQAAVMKFVSDSNTTAASIQANWYLKSDATADWDIRKGANGLHICAWFGLTNAISSLLARGLDVDSRDPKYAQTPMMYACRRGHAAAVRTLLEHGADVNVYSNRGSSAIFEAVNANNVETLKVLLADPRLNADAPHLSRSRMSPLMLAAQEGYFEIATALLDHKCLSLNYKDMNDDTALFHAIQAKQSEIASCILDHKDKNIDLDWQNLLGRTALILAATKGLDSIVDHLLDEGANPYIKDKEGGGTGLLRAIDEGRLSTVEIMLNHNVNVHCLDDKDRSLLHGAAVGGYDDLVHLLLGKDLNANAVDKRGVTPLHDAARNDRFTTAQILLDNGAIFWLKDSSGRTPWTVAWQNGRRSILQVLGSQGPHEVTEQDLSGEYPNAEELPVWSLALLGKKDLIIEALSTRRNEISFLDPDTSNTSLHGAVLSDQPEIVEILLEAGMSIDATNDYFRTPLHMAALNGNLGIMRLLLNDRLTDDHIINAKDKWGTTAILMAYTHRHIECSLLLIENGAAIPDSKQSMKQSLFFFAVEFGCLQAVIELVNMGADVQVKNVLGLTGLQMAQDGGKSDIENYLRKNKSFWVNGSDLVNEQGEEEMKMASMRLGASPFHGREIWKEERELGEEVPWA
ncbi:hypothetical protein N7G274_003295 [Stereocaulon virgatum]|uniref:ZZ-type domain-containing protein n=1 Tax=Stereocaulon virgatum TaxID=373712 RepID=A0ABR4AG27_9LECA